MPSASQVVPFTGYVRKTASTARVNNTLAVDPHLVLPLRATGFYLVRAMLIWQLDTVTTQGFKLQFTNAGSSIVSGGACYGVGNRDGGNAAGFCFPNGNSTVGLITAAGGIGGFQHQGVIQLNAAGANLEVWWAQGVTDAANAANLVVGSWLVATYLGP